VRLKEILKPLIIPLVILIAYLFFYGLWIILKLPSPEELFNITKQLFDKYGLWIVFLGAIVEGILLLGNYFPGSLIIFLGVLSAGKDIVRVTEVIILVIIAFFISSCINYFLGKYGWYRLFVRFGLSKILDNYKQKVEKHGLNIIFLTYWQPNLASLTSTSAGILKFPLKKFLLYSIIGIIIWAVFWGTLIYTLGQAAIEILGFKFIIFFILAWIAVLIARRIILEKFKPRE